MFSPASVCKKVREVEAGRLQRVMEGKRLDYIRQNSSPYQLTVLRMHWLDGAVFSPASVRESA